MLQTYAGTILVVDDNPTNLKLLLDVLGGDKFQVKIAKSGEEALKKLEYSLPDIILLDIQMPGMDGFETCKYIQANPTTNTIPIIFMTSQDSVMSKVKGLQMGAVDYITKPFHQEEVIARIDVHLRLHRTQLQLLQAAKQLAVGQLAAGVAHEINNPINFIYGNLRHMEGYIGSLLELIEHYEQQQDRFSIQRFQDEVNLNFVRQDIPKLLSSMSHGAERIRNLVRSLHNFSRFNESEWKQVDISEGLDNTLVLLSDRLRPITAEAPGIKIIRDYQVVPQALCYPALVNEALMHLMLNAIEALERKILGAVSAFAPELLIRTNVSEDQQHILIHIQDNGTGIDYGVQQRMFEQFYTTKKIGQGMGLGLAIAQQIVEQRHRGKLTYESALGEGSCFTVHLPMGQ